jgi:hypothetical protein
MIFHLKETKFQRGAILREAETTERLRRIPNGDTPEPDVPWTGIQTRKEAIPGQSEPTR